MKTWIGVLIVNFLLFIVFLILKQFHPILLGLHLVSILVLLGLLVGPAKKLLNSISFNIRDWVIMLFVLVLALGVRLYQIEEISPGMYGDEVTVGRESLQLWDSGKITPFVSRYSHPSPLLYLTAASLKVFGQTMTADRLPSVVFGALACCLAYLFLRMHLERKFALVGALLMTFSYPFVILSRLAYEPPASVFFEIGALGFLYLYLRKSGWLRLVGLGLFLALGCYTYLNFRTFAVFIIATALAVILMSKKPKKLKLAEIGVLLGTFLATGAPLWSYALIDSHGFWSRVSEISIFSRGYSETEFIKELWGNSTRTLGIFYFLGDPNPGKNPSGTPLFDYGTVAFFLLGLVYLFNYSKKAFFLVGLLFIPVLSSDVFSTEVIPEFHYYGLGHPNGLRVSGTIPLVLCVSILGMKWIWDKIALSDRNLATLALGTVVAIAIFLNAQWYFGQEVNNPTYFEYNYKVNGKDVLDAIKLANKIGPSRILMSPPLKNNERVPFFLRKDIAVEGLTATESGQIITLAKQTPMTWIQIENDNIKTVNEIAAEAQKGGGSMELNLIRSPLGLPRILIVQSLIK